MFEERKCQQVDKWRTLQAASQTRRPRVTVDLKAKLHSAVEVAFVHGATEWVRLERLLLRFDDIAGLQVKRACLALARKHAHSRLAFDYVEPLVPVGVPVQLAHSTWVDLNQSGGDSSTFCCIASAVLTATSMIAAKTSSLIILFCSYFRIQESTGLADRICFTKDKPRFHNNLIFDEVDAECRNSMGIC